MNEPIISFDQALKIVTGSAKPLDTERVDFPHMLSRVLAEDIWSDMDMPPFNKSAMDGYACRRADLAGIMEVIETIPAGKNPTLTLATGQCAKIMTGAMLPPGADVVIKVEETMLLDEFHVRFTEKDTYHNICYRAEDVKTGQLVLEKGTLLQPQHLAILATFGKVNPLVYRKVKVGIGSTGDELVEPQDVPGLSGIRNSNAWQLMAQAEKTGLKPAYYGISKDTETDLAEMILKASEENDLILITGGVSMGDFDLVPKVLKNLGFQIRFRKIAVQPGSPTLFATKTDNWCFGLPGNPVSSFVQFELLVKPLVYSLMGHIFKPQIIHLPMAGEYTRKKAERLAWIPVKIENGLAVILEYHGSAHIHAYADADGFLKIEKGIMMLKKGEGADVRLI
ncbi:MAG: molybdopterin molybdotransferase MoeA [Bacteroidetes bacterium]|nr:molybdopterin molybdotransferase MoeA [Bacteroidota bacterium]